MLPVASSLGGGNLRVTNYPIGDFAIWASTPQAAKLTGDFNGDGWGDVALTGPVGWNSLPMAFSNGNGTFAETNRFVGAFASWASTPQVTKLTGDINGDGKTDIALTGAPGWNSLPVAFSLGNGSFSVTNAFVGDFASYASNTQVMKLTGDFNGDGKMDIALTGGAGWNTLPLAFSNGDGSFRVTNSYIGIFAYWASQTQAVKLAGDFNGDGKTDIVLTGVPGLNTLPMALSRGDGNFEVINLNVGTFASWASNTQFAKLTGDFNGDGRTDIALTGAPYWSTVPILLSDRNGTFTVKNESANIAYYSAYPQSVKLTGDFNGDGRTDLAVIHPAFVGFIATASFRDNGTIDEVHRGFANFWNWAWTENAAILTWDFN
jgi:hypothetical protein